MAKVAIIGAGFAGQAAALYLGDALGAEHEITVINRLKDFSYVPSWVWVGIGRMPVEKTTFPLGPVYDRFDVRFVHGRATEVRVAERTVLVERDGGAGTTIVPYDHLIIATGPRLDFEGTEGLGPENGFSQSICTAPHVVRARDRYLEEVERMKTGERRRFVIGTGHPGATCQGAAFEYITNVHKDLLRRGVRDKADLLWLSNEQALGDFGVRGVSVRRKGRVLTSEEFIGEVFKEYGIRSQVKTGVLGLTENAIAWEDFDGGKGEAGFDFSMLNPRFLGQPLAFVDGDGADLSADILAERPRQSGREVRAALRRTGAAARGLALGLSEPGPSRDLRRRHRVRAAGPDLRAAHHAERHGHRRRAAADRHGVRHHRPGRGAEHHRPGQDGDDDPRRAHDEMRAARAPPWPSSVRRLGRSPDDPRRCPHRVRAAGPRFPCRT